MRKSWKLITNYDVYINKLQQLPKSFIRATIFESLSLLKYGEKSKSSDFENLWGKSSFEPSEKARFYDIFGHYIQIWKLSPLRTREISGSKIYGQNADPALILGVPANFDPDFDVIEKTQELYFVSKPSALNYFPCPEKNCIFACNSPGNLKTHMALHEIENRIHCTEKKYPEDDILSELKIQGLLPINFRDENTICWDIECLVTPTKDPNFFQHIPISIGVTKNYGSGQREFFILRRSLDPAGLRDMVSDFLNLLDSLETEFFSSFPKDFWDGWNRVKQELERPDLTPAALARLKSYRSKMASYFSPKVLGYNTERYDIPVLVSCLFDQMLARDPNFTVVKRGSGFMTIKYKKYQFLDVKNFAPPVSLANFAKSFNVKTSKDVWPYKFYQSIDQIRSATQFPKIEVFEDDKSENKNYHFFEYLIKEEFESGDASKVFKFFGITDSILIDTPTQNWGPDHFALLEQRLKIDPIRYYQAKQNFDQKIRDGTWKSMLCQLKWYNLMDCHVLQETWHRYCSEFFTTFNIDVMGILNYLLSYYSLKMIYHNIRIYKQ